LGSAGAEPWAVGWSLWLAEKRLTFLDWSLWEIVWDRLGPLYHDVSCCIPVPCLCQNISTNLQITSLQVAKQSRLGILTWSLRGICVTWIHLGKLQQNTGNIQPTAPIQPMALSDTRDYNRAIARGSWPRGGCCHRVVKSDRLLHLRINGWFRWFIFPLGPKMLGLFSGGELKLLVSGEVFWYILCFQRLGKTPPFWRCTKKARLLWNVTGISPV